MDKNEHKHHWDYWDWRARNFEVQDIGVHGCAFLDSECLELSQTRVHEYNANIIGSKKIGVLLLLLHN